jgi:GntR family transcriptional regulator
MDDNAGLRGDSLGFRPLYRQVRDALVRRIIDGLWEPGAALPSETHIAMELGVSQGTVRKALDEMAAERLVIRRQGRGTFVAKHDDECLLFRFFRLAHDNGVRDFPESRLLRAGVHIADGVECERLGLLSGAEAVRILRVRYLGRRAAIIERISVPHRLMPDLANSGVPNNLYAHYAVHYGITIMRAREQLKAVALDAADAAILGVETHAPALAIDRLALSLDEIPVEWRVSLCLTADLHYVSDLRSGTA